MGRLVAIVTLSIALAAALAPQRANAQSPAADARLAGVRPQLEAARRAAASESLPPEWIDAKIAEGLAKRVPPQSIAAAVQTLLGRMRTADRLLRPLPGRPSATGRRRALRATVDALAAGAPERGIGAIVSDIARSRSARAWDDAREAMVVVAELGERGFGGGEAANLARRAYGQRGRDGLSDVLETARSLRERDPNARRARLERVIEGGRGRGGPPEGRGGPRRDEGFGRGRP